MKAYVVWIQVCARPFQNTWAEKSPGHVSSGSICQCFAECWASANKKHSWFCLHLELGKWSIFGNKRPCVIETPATNGDFFQPDFCFGWQIHSNLLRVNTSHVSPRLLPFQLPSSLVSDYFVAGNVNPGLIHHGLLSVSPPNSDKRWFWYTPNETFGVYSSRSLT